jgi:hypothetical protein
MKRIIRLTVAVAALTLLVGGVSFAAQGPANNSNPLVVHFSAGRPPSTISSTLGLQTPAQAPSTSGPTASFLPTHPRTRSALPS